MPEENIESLLNVMSLMSSDALKEKLDNMIDNGRLEEDVTKNTGNHAEYVSTERPKLRVHIIKEPLRISKIEEELR